MTDEAEGGGEVARWSPELGAEICARVAEGESLRQLWRSRPGMPNPSSVGLWRRQHPEFRLELLAAQRKARLAARAMDEQRQFEARLAGLARPRRPATPCRLTYSEALSEAICERLAAGESLSAICAEEGMPTASTVLRWVRDMPEFRTRYVWARRVQGEALVDEALEVARAATPGVAAVARLRIDTLRWQAARVAPAKYVGADEEDDGRKVIVVQQVHFSSLDREDGGGAAG